VDDFFEGPRSAIGCDLDESPSAIAEKSPDVLERVSRPATVSKSGDERCHDGWIRDIRSGVMIKALVVQPPIRTFWITL
jgi:hypothetical protein